jgi:hypothetical protein
MSLDCASNRASLRALIGRMRLTISATSRNRVWVAGARRRPRPICGRPPPRKVFCSVLIRSLRPYVRPVDALAHERWPRWFPRQGFQTTVRPQRGGHWVYRSVPCRGSIDHTICSSSCKFWHRLSPVAVKSLPVSGQSLCGDCGLGAVGFPGHHHLPGDTRGLVGQRNGGQFRRLALE